MSLMRYLSLQLKWYTVRPTISKLQFRFLIDILLRKFDTLSKKEIKMIKTQIFL